MTARASASRPAPSLPPTASRSSARRPTVSPVLRPRGRSDPDLVLLDIGLPDVEGFEVARELAIDGPPPFVVLTSSREAGVYGPRLDASRVLGFIPKDELSGPAIRALIPVP